VIAMPFGAFINVFPPAFFLIVHLTAFAIGAYLAYRAIQGQAPMLGWGFTLYAIAELIYMTYHLDWTVFLFAHTVAEVLDLIAFVAVFIGATQRVLSRGRVVAAGD
jgi:hypothetical protein